MKTKTKALLWTLLSLAAIAISVMFIAKHSIPVLEPKGMIGMKERDLMFTSALLMLVVVIPVFIFTVVFAWKYRESNEAARHEPDWEHNNIAEYCWWGVPLIIIVILAVITWKSSHELNPFRPIENGKRPITIQAVALQWKWLFIYPEHGIATINYIEFPEKTPLNFQITADAPMNAFWIPQLGGQIYAMPAMVSKLHLIADEEGTFRGLSSNFSGTGFAGMQFTARSRSQDGFDQWVQGIRGSSNAMNFEAFLPLVAPSSYDSPAFYVLTQSDLFERIVEQYSPPKAEVLTRGVNRWQRMALARQSQIEASAQGAPKKGLFWGKKRVVRMSEDPCQKDKASEEDRYGKVAASHLSPVYNSG